MTEDRTTAERQAAWAVLLDTWRTHDLPVPDMISVATYGIAAVRLPNNERGQVDQWATALQVGRVVVTKAAGAYRNPAAESPLLPGWIVDTICHLDDDPDKLWSGLVAPSPLVAALSSTAEHLTAEPKLTQDDHLADYGPNVPTPAEPAHRTAAEVVAYINSLPRYGMENPVAEIPEVVIATSRSYSHWRTGLILADGTELIATSEDEGYPAGWVIRTAAEPAPAAPVAVSPERAAEILRALNIESGTDEDLFITGLDEYDNGSRRFNGKRVFSFALLDGTVIRREMFESVVAADNAWAVRS